MKRFHIQRDQVSNEQLQEYAVLILTAGSFEWFLQEAIILLTLEKEFDPTQKSHEVLAEHVESLSFDRKIRLIKKFQLLSADLQKEMDILRQRRNIFVHGILIARGLDVKIEILKKRQSELFSKENIQQFTSEMENLGGRLVDEFGKAGFHLAQLQKAKI